jgi:hypothetical protein
MKKIRPEDIQDLVAYEKVRSEFRKGIMALKKTRRFAVGDKITFVFENRDTVLFQIQEMVRVERLVREEAILHEVETYNILIPDPGQISATMLIEIQDLTSIKAVLDGLVGITRDRVSLSFAGEKIHPSFDEGQSEEGRISAVQYVRFSFTDAQLSLFRNPEIAASLRIDHPNYAHEALIGPELRAQLIADLAP